MDFGEQKGISTELGGGRVRFSARVLCSSSHLILTNTLGGHYSLIHSPTHLATELILGTEYLMCARAFLRTNGMRHRKS